MSWRPSTLAEIASRARQGSDFGMLTREFVDELAHKTPDQVAQSVAEEPQGPWRSAVHKAFLAAMAEHYARRAGLKSPAWAEQPECFLDRAHFGTPLQSLRAHLLIASPPAFKRRLIFVDRDPIPRAPRPVEFTEIPKPALSGRVVSLKG